MRIEMHALTPDDAKKILFAAGALIGGDYDTLRFDEKIKLLKASDRYTYRAPKHANGSKGRYWHDRLQREAAKA